MWSLHRDAYNMDNIVVGFSEKAVEKEVTVFCNLISEDTSRHFYHMLLITQNNLCVIWEGTTQECAFRKWDKQSHPGGWVSHILWLNWIASPVILGVVACKLNFSDIHVTSLRPLIFTWRLLEN